MRMPLIILAGVVVFGVALGAPAGPMAAPLAPQGAVQGLVLPAGTADALLSLDGTWAAVATVTFNRARSVPERVVLGVDVAGAAAVWRTALPSRSCCAFPVLAMTPGGDGVVVGGAEESSLYDREGRVRFTAALQDGRLHSAVGVADDGTLLVVGESEGTMAAFRTGRRAPVWASDRRQRLLALALSGDGRTVVAALVDRWLLVRARDGRILSEGPYGPARIAAAAVSEDGQRAGLVWKRADARMVVQFLRRGRTRWTRVLEPGTVPSLQMDRRGRWLAVGDFRGAQAALMSAEGATIWRSSGPGWTTAGVAPDGSRAAVARGARVEVLALPSGQRVWGNRLPGPAQLLRLAGSRLAVLGAVDGDGLPDRLWFADVGRAR